MRNPAFRPDGPGGLPREQLDRLVTRILDFCQINAALRDLDEATVRALIPALSDDAVWAYVKTRVFPER